MGVEEIVFSNFKYIMGQAPAKMQIFVEDTAKEIIKGGRNGYLRRT